MSIRLMTDVWDIPNVGSATVRLVLLALADQASDDGVCWPFMATIASRADCGLSSARKACAELESQGLLTRKLQKVDGGKNNDRSVYVINAALLAERAGAARSERRAAKVERGGPLKSSGGAAQIERHNPQVNPKEEPKDSGAVASEALFEVEQPEEKTARTAKEPTANQRANALAAHHYERLDKMGNVPAFMKIIVKAVNAGYDDDRIRAALDYIAENHWTLTAERLRNTLEGGARLPTRAAPGRTSTAARRVGNQLLEG
jgi:hypothetical protein